MTADTPALAADQPETAVRPAKRKSGWWEEVKGLFWLIMAVLGFHSFIAKPFYIPSESMLPVLMKGDRLVVTKYPYGWSFISPTVPNPAAIFRGVVLRQPEESWGVQLPFTQGRLFGRMPERGDVVIVTPPGRNTDYIKRLIGLPGDRLQVRGGVLYINGQAVRRGPLHYKDVPVDANATCDDYPGALIQGANGQPICHLPLITETLPNGRRYDTVEMGYSQGDNYGPITIPAGHVFLMGDNRDRSSDSRFSLAPPELGLGGAVPWEYVGGRAEFITFSLDGTTSWNPLTWWASLRGGRTGNSLHPEETAK
ncbi:signal peptidase I [Sphingomonas hylomeconis]|uniref:Signal peptidase I n=1 Tax=Sphingomonas hylomeconis TaxID=1395958 RepID=A0ABV7SQW2_9SPHN|nr:signal peptidase I [Sphingomonas hylomeconis]